MAGGMTRRNGPTLAERVAATQPRRGDDARHCCVVDAAGHPGRWPGVSSNGAVKTTGGSVGSPTPSPTSTDPALGYSNDGSPPDASRLRRGRRPDFRCGSGLPYVIFSVANGLA